MQTEEKSLELEHSGRVLQMYLEGQIREYSEMCDTLRAYYSQNMEKIETCKTDVRIMRSREDSGFALLSPISIESSFQVEIAQAQEKQELLEKQNEKYLRDIRFYEGKIREMEEQLEKASEQERMEQESAAALEPQAEETPDGEPADALYQEETSFYTSDSSGSGAGGVYRGDLLQDLQTLAQYVTAASRFARVDPRRTSVELSKVEQQIRRMEKNTESREETADVSSPAAGSAALPSPGGEDTAQEASEIKNETEPNMHLPHSSYLQPGGQREVYRPEQADRLPEREDPPQEEEMICVQASDISDVFEEYVDSYAAISSKRTDYYYEDEFEMDVPKDMANRFVILCQKFYKYLLNYANCSYIQFHLQSHRNVLAVLFEWTSDNTAKDMEETVEWRNLRRDAVKNGLDVNRNCFDNDVIRITVAGRIGE